MHNKLGKRTALDKAGYNLEIIDKIEKAEIEIFDRNGQVE